MTFNDFKNWFRHSETIFFARLNVAVGAIWTAAIATDLSPVITNPKYFAFWTMASGAITEYLRRRGTETVTEVIAPATPSAPAVVTKMLSDAPPPGA